MVRKNHEDRRRLLVEAPLTCNLSNVDARDMCQHE